VTNLSTVDFIIATGGSLDASMLFTVSAENALLPRAGSSAASGDSTLTATLAISSPPAASARTPRAT
jgi:hypothetical protein